MKKIIGIVSMVLFIIVLLQSCAAGVSNTLQNNSEVSGSAGGMLAFFMLIAGVISTISKNSKGMTITAIIFYVMGGFMGVSLSGSFKDLEIWGWLNIIFAMLLTFHIVKYKSTYKTAEA